MAEKPTTAFVLSLIGGIFVLLVGIAFAVLGAILGNMVSGIGGPAGATNIVVLYGVIGFVNGLLMIVFGVLLYIRPMQHVAWGALVLILSIASFFTTLGGFFASRSPPARAVPAACISAARRHAPRGPHDPPRHPDRPRRAPAHRRAVDPHWRRTAPRVRSDRERDRRDRVRLRPHLDRGRRRPPPPARLGLVARGHRDGPLDRRKHRVAHHGGHPPPDPDLPDRRAPPLPVNRRGRNLFSGWHFGRGGDLLLVVHPF